MADMQTIARLPGENHAHAHRGQVEDADPAEAHRPRIAEGTYRPAAGHGGQRAGQPQGVRGGSARVEYTLTDLGRSLKPVLDALRDWSENCKARA